MIVVVALPLAWREYVGDSLTGGYTGREERMMAHSCDGTADDATMEFARTAGRIGRVNGRPFLREADGCYVMLLVPHTAGPDPLDAIDKAVVTQGWARTEETRWVRSSDGFTVTVRQSEPDDPMLAEYEIDLWGSVGD